MRQNGSTRLSHIHNDEYWKRLRAEFRGEVPRTSAGAYRMIQTGAVPLDVKVIMGRDKDD